MAPRQLILDLPVRTSTGRDDFFVTAANEAAVGVIDAWPDWPGPVMMLVGPAGSGKSHLGAVWASQSGAAMITASAIRAAAVPDLLKTGALLVEDAPGAELDEAAFFHLLNLAREMKASVLVTARDDPARWPVNLPDLRTRLLVLDVIRLGRPDDQLMRGVIVKQFQDRQIAADEAVVSYMLTHMERSLEAVRRLVAEIDRAALEQKTRITRAFVAHVMAENAEPGLFDEE